MAGDAVMEQTPSVDETLAGLVGQKAPEPDVAIGADRLFAIRERQDLLTQTAVLGEGLLVHLL